MLAASLKNRSIPIMPSDLEITEISTVLGAQTSDQAIVSRHQREAAVALILAPNSDGLEALFILRAKKAGDPWSGQMALPGGHRDPGDVSLKTTASRETWEETGLNLDQTARYLGALEPVRANPRSGIDLLVTPQVFALEETRPSLAPNEEVAQVLWGDLNGMRSGRLKTEAQFPEFQRSGTFPGYQVDDQVVWGLTYRMLNDFFALFP